MVRSIAHNRRTCACVTGFTLLLLACGNDAGRLTPVGSTTLLRTPKPAGVEAPPTPSAEHRAEVDDEAAYDMPSTDARFIAPYTVEFEPPRAYLFASQRLPAPTTVTIRNRGTQPFSVLDVYVSGSTLEAAARFSVLDAPNSHTLQPGESTTVTVSFLGGTYETVTASLMFATSIPHTGVKNVPLTAKVFR